MDQTQPTAPLQPGKSAFSALQTSSVTVMTAITQVDGLTSMRLLVARSVCIGSQSTSLNAPNADSEPVIDVNATDFKTASGGLRGYMKISQKQTSDSGLYWVIWLKLET